MVAALLTGALGPGTVATVPAAGVVHMGQVARTGWDWPLHPAPVVVRRFEPPSVVWAAGHRGVDLAPADPDAGGAVAVLAPAAGVVAFAGMVAGRPVLVVGHGAVRSTFEPVVAEVPVGTVVAAGDRIGRLVGDGSHCRPRACLHWGVLRGDTYLDPLALLGQVRVRVRLLPMP